MQIRDLVPDLAPVILAAREQRDARNTLAQFLPNTPVADVSYRLGRQQRLDQRVPVRALDAPATPIRRPGVLDVRGDLPAITPIEYLTESDLTLAQRLAGVAVDLAPSVAAAARRVALTVDNTLELMRGQVLATGIVSLELEDGNVRPVDFAIPAGQKVTPGTVWTSATLAQMMADLQAWNQAFLTASGASAGAILSSTRTRRLFAGALQSAYPQQPVGSATVDAYLAANDLPGFITNDRTLTNVDSSRTRVYPENALTLLPTADVPIGRTELGITQEAVQQVQGRVLTAAQAPGLTIVTLGQDNPVQRAVKGAAIGLPVLQDVDSIVVASGLYTASA